MTKFALAGLMIVGAAGAASAQLPPRKTTTVAASQIDASSRVLVATAVVEGEATPADAVAFSNAMRTAVTKAVDGKLTVVTRERMNEALKTFGYNADEILPDAPVQALADQLKTGKLVTAKLTKTGGKLSAVATVKGKGDVTATQEDGQSAAAFGEAVAQLVKANLN